jgi:hypothetical protein
MKKPTRQDTETLFRLMQTFSTPEDHEAGLWFDKNFSAKDYAEFKSKYPVGSPEYHHIGHVLAAYEVAGVLISHGLLNENLYFDSFDVMHTWNKVKDIIPDWQKEAGPALWENYVWLAKRYQWWLKHVWKPNQKWKTRAP